VRYALVHSGSTALVRSALVHRGGTALLRSALVHSGSTARVVLQPWPGDDGISFLFRVLNQKFLLLLLPLFERCTARECAFFIKQLSCLVD
jgi:hypothetical protein